MEIEIPLLVARLAITAHATLWECGKFVGECERSVECMSRFAKAIRKPHHSGLLTRYAASGEDEIERMRVTDQTR